MFAILPSVCGLCPIGSASTRYTVRYAVNGNEFKPGTPHGRLEKLGANPDDWDLAPDGRIAVVTPVAGDSKAATDATPSDHAVVFVQNFSEEVRRRVK